MDAGRFVIIDTMWVRIEGQIDCDAQMYKWRHLIENHFAKIKEFPGIATRYDKTDTSFRANLNLTATLIAVDKCPQT
ncbi:hypothetical protein Sphch_3282 [Sphingobium chlorophenolicum L-1]|uniref:Transposase n=1 Tax=Sphingobium chlorophenolicum L-1 TaxID=690566 RepID=F6F375_SPHCR|nr:hypothetical protein Sphch_3282 [Sphingobium chlorophenolicum L-1]